jgi:hypothetical protein
MEAFYDITDWKNIDLVCEKLEEVTTAFDDIL